jgi:predicted TIM-barrel fold metal-dependent hydrolase
MLLDGHIHAHPGKANPKEFAARLREAGVAGGVVLSPAPPSYGNELAGGAPQERLECVLEWTAGRRLLSPFFWIDPVEAGAGRQVKLAVDRGAAGFKVICTHFYPGDRRAMKVYAAIAETGRPILFHSGILWNPSPSSQYNRPAGFEALLEIPHLRFALAHIGWPWCDELIAVYGKSLAVRSRRRGTPAEMFIDTTPGTPVIYRKDALTKLFTVGYDVRSNVFFGTDGLTRSYDVKWARAWASRDRRICRSLGLPASDMDKMFAENLQRFVGG